MSVTTGILPDDHPEVRRQKYRNRRYSREPEMVTLPEVIEKPKKTKKEIKE